MRTKKSRTLHFCLIYFSWLTKLFVKGSKKILDKDDLQGIMPGESMYPLTEKLERYLVDVFDDLSINRPATLLKRDSNTGVFLRILRNSLEHVFLQCTSQINRKSASRLD